MKFGLAGVLTAGNVDSADLDVFTHNWLAER